MAEKYNTLPPPFKPPCVHLSLLSVKTHAGPSSRRRGKQYGHPKPWARGAKGSEPWWQGRKASGLKLSTPCFRKLRPRHRKHQHAWRGNIRWPWGDHLMYPRACIILQKGKHKDIPSVIGDYLHTKSCTFPFPYITIHIFLHHLFRCQVVQLETQQHNQHLLIWMWLFPFPSFDERKAKMQGQTRSY